MNKDSVKNIETDVLDWINGTNTELKISLPNKIYDHILTQIFLGNITFGQRIRESQVTKELNVSNVPVRETFIRLREEGWIETIPNCGAKIVDYHDHEKHNELYNMRLSLETGIFYCLAGKITTDQLLELDEIVGRLENALKDGDVVEYRRADAEFHMKIVFFAGGERMQRLYRPIFLQWCIMIHLYNEKHRSADSNKGDKEKKRATEEIPHRALYNAFKENDGSLAAELIRKHFAVPE